MTYFTGYTGNVTIANLQVTNNASSNPPYITVWNSTTENLVANTSTAVLFDSVDGNNIITLGNNGSPPNSRVQFNHVGTFNVQFSAQVDKTSTGGALSNLVFWMSKNGTAIADTGGLFSIDTSTRLVQSWNFIVDSTATSDYLELYVGTDTGNITLPAYNANSIGNITHPAIPAVILTVVPVGA